MTRFIETLKIARDAISVDVTVQRLLVLLCVAENEGCNQQELGNILTGISTTALSRNLADLSATTSRKMSGPALIRQQPDPANLRRRIIRLTARGRRLVEKLQTALDRR